MSEVYIMKLSVNQQTDTKSLPVLSSQNQDWENILVSQFQCSSGEATCHFEHEHTVYLSLTPHPVRFLHIKEGKTYTGFCQKGSMAITPAKRRLSARWHTETSFIEIRITSPFVERVAHETLNKQPSALDPLLGFRIYGPQLESIALLLFAELRQKNLGSRLYIDSLSNILVVHLLRQYTTAKLDVSTYEGGLSQHQMAQVLDYINDYLHQDIKLADLAVLLDMSQYHFCHLFKQSIAVPPYQYLLQQRVERAKQLLKNSDRSIADIALLCGFNSHSHLSKQFRQLTGMTPKAYRVN
jgi:AraC family transcriptional regulator